MDKFFRKKISSQEYEALLAKRNKSWAYKIANKFNPHNLHEIFNLENLNFFSKFKNNSLEFIKDRYAKDSHFRMHINFAYLAEQRLKNSKSLPIAIAAAVIAGVAYWLGHRDGE